VKLYIRKDEWGWDMPLLNAAKLMGLDHFIFSDSSEIIDQENTYVFLHMRHAMRFREVDKKLAESLAQLKNIVMIPTIYECRLYDDKIRQSKGLSKWMPKTLYLTTSTEAQMALRGVSFPLISKSNIGAGSSNIRMLENESQAKEEIKLTFEGEGIVIHSNLRQRNYLLWQEFCPKNENDWRVILIARRYAMVLKRYNRPNLPFASGSGNFDFITNLNTDIEQMLNLTYDFASEYGFTFVGVDIVKNKNNKYVILEMTAGWNMDVYTGCRFFERVNDNWLPTEYYGPDQFLLIAKSIIDGNFTF
jgi:glutathione synthase/RimK-type ligase-like ATP-grasp enzyme